MISIYLAFHDCCNSLWTFWVRQGSKVSPGRLRIHNLLEWRLSWGLQAVFGNVFRGCTVHLPWVISSRFVCWSSAVYQWFVWQCDGLGRKITLISCAGLKKPPCTFQRSSRVDLIFRKLLLLPTELPSNSAGRLGPRKVLLHSSLWQESSFWEEDGATAQRKDILMHLCCYYYLK